MKKYFQLLVFAFLGISIASCDSGKRVTKPPEEKEGAEEKLRLSYNKHVVDRGWTRYFMYQNPERQLQLYLSRELILNLDNDEVVEDSLDSEGNLIIKEQNVDGQIIYADQLQCVIIDDENNLQILKVDCGPIKGKQSPYLFFASEGEDGSYKLVPEKGHTETIDWEGSSYKPNKWDIYLNLVKRRDTKEGTEAVDVEGRKVNSKSTGTSGGQNQRRNGSEPLPTVRPQDRVTNSPREIETAPEKSSTPTQTQPKQQQSQPKPKNKLPF